MGLEVKESFEKLHLQGGHSSLSDKRTCRHCDPRRATSQTAGSQCQVHHRRPQEDGLAQERDEPRGMTRATEKAGVQSGVTLWPGVHKFLSQKKRGKLELCYTDAH